MVMAKKKPEQDIVLIKITNPLWMEILAPHVKDYFDRVKLPGMSYEALMTFFLNIVQLGGEAAEFWCAFKDNKPVGFCMWNLMGLPYNGVAHCDQFHVWDDDKRISKMFMAKLMEYATSKRCSYIHAFLINRKVADHFVSMSDELNLAIIEPGKVEMYARRKET
jgi:hypothetical protein